MKRLRRCAVGITYAAGVACAATIGFCSPIWYLGFAPLAAGLVWASYDLVDDGEEATGGNTPRTPRR